MELKLIRGDTYKLTFSLVTANNQPLLLSDEDKCYFTVKKEFMCEDCVLQKRYRDGISYNPLRELYEIKLNQDDTSDLKCGSYKFDIKVKIGGEIVKTIVKGTLALVNNATHRCNE